MFQLRPEDDSLPKAELDMSLAKATATTNVLSRSNDPVASDEGAKPTVGPTLMTEIQVEGQPAQALIDTGSTVSLISIDFLLQALLSGVGREKTSAEKMETLRARLEPRPWQ